MEAGVTNICNRIFAGELLQEGDDKSTTEELEIKTEQETVKNNPSNVSNICDQGSSNRNFFVYEMISHAPVIHERSQWFFFLTKLKSKSRLVIKVDEKASRNWNCS
nr:telomere repeat-binding protein 5-like [Tanacetum cinerariifolium]